MAPVPTHVPPPGLKTSLDDFKELVNQKYNLRLAPYRLSSSSRLFLLVVNPATYAELHAFSVSRMNDFWMTLWEFAGIKASVHPVKAVEDDARIDEFPSFFEDARLNFADNIVGAKDKGLTIIGMNESNMSQPERYSWQDLRELVQRYADALKSSGLIKGEVVALVGSNCIRSLALVLATAAVEGIFSSFATDMGGKVRAPTRKRLTAGSNSDVDNEEVLPIFFMGCRWRERLSSNLYGKVP